MPRKKYISNNPYCRRSRLTENEFIGLVYCYFKEANDIMSRKDCLSYYLNIVNDSHKIRKREGGLNLSRQAFSKYFEKISQFIWDNNIAPYFPFLQREGFFDDLLDIIYGGKGTKLVRKELFQIIGHKPLYITEENLRNSWFFYLLSERSKAIRGFKKEKFYLEFSRALFICLGIEIGGFKPNTIDLKDDEKLKGDISAYLAKRLISHFYGNPL